MATDCEGRAPGTQAAVTVAEEGRCGSGTPECLGDKSIPSLLRCALGREESDLISECDFLHLPFGCLIVYGLGVSLGRETGTRIAVEVSGQLVGVRS